MNIQFGGREESYDIRNYNEGITRKKVGNNFVYYYIKSNKDVEKSHIERIKKLKIPPAWTNVWISSDTKSNIQVVGIDIKGRKQYKYHEEHIQKAEMEKFLRLIEFIKAIPKLEKIISEHQKLHSYAKFRVITTMIILVKLLHIRVGKEQYARENKSYGISSLKKIHVNLDTDKILLRFKGKSNQRLSYSLKNEKIKEHLALLKQLAGDKIFQYIDIDDKIKKVTDTDLNNYIQEYMGSEFTMKDFRTYAANLHFVTAILDETKKRSPKNEKVIKKNIINALDRTAHYLRHTRSISKKSYVMNFCIDMYMQNPEYFTKRKDDDPHGVLLDLLQMYKKNIVKE